MPISTISNGEAGSSVRTSLNQVIDFVNSLGTPTTVGVSILDSTNPSAVTFLRANADNTVTWLSAADFRTAIGLGSIATQESNAVSITGGTITGLTDFGVSMANNTAMTGFALGTISDTTSRPLNITQTWNNAGLTATALKVAVTNTSSNSASKLIDLCGGASGTTSLFSVSPAGHVTAAGNIYAGTLLIQANTGMTSTGGLSLVGSGGDVAFSSNFGGKYSWAFRSGTGDLNGSSDAGLAWTGTAANTATAGPDGTVDVKLVRDAASVLALKLSTTAQTLRIYGTTTGSKYLNLTHDGTNSKINSSSGDLHISGFPTSNPGPGIIWYDSGTSNFKMGT